MAKRTSATTERTGGETSTRARRKPAPIAQETLPGMNEAKASSPRASRRRNAGQAAPLTTFEVSLRVAPSNGPRQPARQEPANAQQAPADARAATDGRATSRPEPKRARKMSSRRIGDLREALADGWEIVQPIFARPLWTAADDSQTAFNFVLRRDQATRLLTIPDSRTVERFIATHSLQVDYRR